MISKFSLLDFFFPNTCLFCFRRDFLSARIGVCKKCYLRKSPENNHKCKICKNELGQKENCEYCDSRNIFFENLEYIRSREEEEKKILKSIKFQNKKHLSYYFRIGLTRTLAQIPLHKIQLFTTVPSNLSTIRKRPFHPAFSIISYLQNRRNLPYTPLLNKISRKLQSSQNFSNRFIHARNAFGIKKEFQSKLSGNILLIDDLFTTGASINECSRILLENGANSVQVLVLIKGNL